MNLFVDTSVWSLALRRDSPPERSEVRRLREGLVGGTVYTTGLVLQESLQGFRGPRGLTQLIERSAAIGMIVPARSDHILAARLRNECRRHGIQIGTIDALLAQLCISRKLVMLSTDRVFRHIAACTRLRLWG